MVKIGGKGQAGYGQKNVSGRSVSARTSSKLTSIAHNNRTPEDDFGDNIDQSRTQNNVLLISEDLEDVYHELFHDSILKYNAKQKRDDRKKPEEKGGYLKEVKEQRNKSKRGTLEPQREYLVQFGRKEDEPFPEELSNTMFKEYLDDFQERYPDLRVYNAAIHNDEATPHMHINFVPVAEGYTRGLEKRPSFSKVLDKHDISFKEFFEEEKEKLAEIMKEHTDEDRIKVGSHKYVKPAQYREMMEEADNKRSEAVKRNMKSGARKRELDNREALLEVREVALNDAGEKVLEANENVRERAEKVTQRENALNEREDAYTAKLSRMNDKENELNEREGSLSEKAERLNEQQEAVNRQKIAVGVKEREVNEKDQGADEKLLEAQNKLDNATDKLSTAEALREEVARMRESIEAVKEENSKLLREIKRFGDKFREMYDAVRNGTLRAETAERVADEFETPLDEPENLEHNIESINLVMDDLDDGQGLSLQ